jgi:very-short-patch-repair endonuclease
VRRELHDTHGLLGDPLLAALALGQHGVVSTAQLNAAGLARGAIHHRVQRGRLHRIHRRVYAVGHTRLTWHGRLWAALLACGGPGAALISHRSAAALHELLPRPGGPVDVTSLRRSSSTPAIRVHRGDTIREVAEVDGLPCTTVSRTLIDLADVLPPHRLERVVHRAEDLRVLDTRGLQEPGRCSLQRALATLRHDEPAITRSELEERFLALVAESDLPRPQTNVLLHGLEVDALWREQDLVAELDGQATHLTAAAFERDRARDARLLLHGLRVVRLTWRQVTREPEATAGLLRRLLHR